MIVGIVAFIVVWLLGAAWLIQSDYYYYKKRPWANRGACLVALTKRQTYWVMAFWPFATVAAIVSYMLMFLLVILVELKDRVKAA